MIHSRLVAYFFLGIATVGSTPELSAREEQNPYAITEQVVELGLQDYNNDAAVITIQEKLKPLSIPTSAQAPRKLSWKEWISSFGSSLTKDPERYQLIGSLLLLGSTLIFFSDPAAQLENLQNFSPMNFLATLASQSLRYFAVNAAHEGGHALTSYLISNKIPEIYLGVNKPTDGVEILPHVTLSSPDPSLGCTTNMPDPLHSQEKFEASIGNIYSQFKTSHPTLNFRELIELPEYQQAIEYASKSANEKSLKNRLKYFAIYIAGAVGGLAANGLIKLGLGESLLSIDYVDIRQLSNLIPYSGSDGGAIVKGALDAPGVVDAGNEVYEYTQGTLLFLKALSELLSQKKDQNPASLGLHALGLAIINYTMQGTFHCTGR